MPLALLISFSYLSLPPAATAATAATTRRILSGGLLPHRIWWGSLRPIAERRASGPRLRPPLDLCREIDPNYLLVASAMIMQGSCTRSTASGTGSPSSIYRYKLKRSIKGLCSDVMDYHSKSTPNFRCIDKNLRQVRVSVCVPCILDPGPGAPIDFWGNDLLFL
jgi:hypothetical protein